VSDGISGHSHRQPRDPPQKLACSRPPSSPLPLSIPPFSFRSLAFFDCETRDDNLARAHEHHLIRERRSNGPSEEQATTILRPICASSVDLAIREYILTYTPSTFMFLGLIQKNRKERPPRGDINSPWEHDMFLGGGSQKSSLVERLSEEQKPPRVNMGAAARALEKATGTKDISIKGASVRGNLIEVKGLVAGTTADDVEVSPFNLPLFEVRC